MITSSSSRKIVAAIACRNNGSRLYGKPLQNLDVVNQITILDNIIACLKSVKMIDEIVLAISEGNDNLIFKDVASKHQLKFIVGDEREVLYRLILAGDSVGGTDIFRVTSESPFVYHQWIDAYCNEHIECDYDATFLDGIIDGCAFEIIKLDALKKSHQLGNQEHRSELCTLFIRQNLDSFKVNKTLGPEDLQRNDLRLTVDNPEDLIVCRAVFKEFYEDAPLFDLHKVVQFLDSQKKLKDLIYPFTEIGYSTMYL